VSYGKVLNYFKLKTDKDKQQSIKIFNTPDFYQGPAGQYQDQEAINKAFEREMKVVKIGGDRKLRKSV
jgi:hypothetical protein